MVMFLSIGQCPEVEKDTDYQGNDLDAVEGILDNLEQCRQACIARPVCVGITFAKTFTIQKNCFLKSSWKPSTKTESPFYDSQEITRACRDWLQGILLAYQAFLCV